MMEKKVIKKKSVVTLKEEELVKVVGGKSARLGLDKYVHNVFSGWLHKWI